MDREGTLLLKRSEVATLLGVEECIAAVEQAFKLHAEGAAAIVYERAMSAGMGLVVNMRG